MNTDESRLTSARLSAFLGVHRRPETGFRRPRRRLRYVLLFAALALDAQPQPPCGNAPVPSYPAISAPPTVRVWEQSNWKPPACIGWPPSDSATLVVTAARFREPGDADALRSRIGAVSKMTGLLYWSTTAQKWQPFIREAYALTAVSGARRDDFVAAEISAGRILYVLQHDNLLGKVAYEIRIAAASPEHIAFSTANAETIRYLGLPLFQPAEIQSICFLDRESKGVWRYYSVLRMPKQSAILTLGHSASLINRAAALFRYLAAIPADQEPPAAR